LVLDAIFVFPNFVFLLKYLGSQAVIRFSRKTLKSVLELVSCTDFFLAQSEKETPQRKKDDVAARVERPKEAPAGVCNSSLRCEELYCSAGIAPEDFKSNKYILINDVFLLFINKY
jgi:hypothetical protein